jgi:hypothetical protein
VACGGKSSANDGHERGGAGGNGGAAGSASAGKPSAGNGDGGAAEVPECAALVDDAPHHVVVDIINDSTETLFVGADMVTCALAPWFDVRDAEDRPLAPPGSCRTTCESAMSANPVGGCPAICLFPQAIELEPGESLMTEWSGQHLELVGLPKACQSAEYPTAQCDRAVAIEPGTFTFSAKAGTELDCSPTGTPCEACTWRSDAGGCVTQGALISGSLRTAEARVELDASYGVGPGNGDGALRLVEIRFEEP